MVVLGELLARRGQILLLVTPCLHHVELRIHLFQPAFWSASSASGHGFDDVFSKLTSALWVGETRHT